jgi:hypothetical protein
MSTVTVMRVSVATRTQTAVHLTDVITGAFSAIIASLGLSAGYLRRHWEVIELGLMTWIEEGSLSAVSLELGDPADPRAILEIPLAYRFTGVGNVEFVASRARLARLTAKLERVPAGTPYRVVVSHDGAHSPVDGWSSTTGANRSGLSVYNLGSLGSAPHAAASLNYLHRRS